jgi:hypothetical protein
MTTPVRLRLSRRKDDAQALRLENRKDRRQVGVFLAPDCADPAAPARTLL